MLRTLRSGLRAAAAVATASLLFAACVGPSSSTSPSASAPGIQTITPGVLKVGSQQSYIPGEFFEEGNDKVQGFSVDFIDEIGKRLGVTVEWQQVDYSAIITGLQSKQFDMGSGGMSPNPDRLAQVDMVGYFQSGATYVLRKEDAGKFTNSQDLCGKTIGMLEGSTTLEAAIAKENEKCGANAIKIQPYTSTPLGLQGLLSKRIDAYTPDVAQSQFIVKESPNDFVTIGDYVLVDYLINYTFTKESTALRNAVFNALQEMMTDGSYDTILTKWGIDRGGLKKPALNGDLDAKP